jgi:putative ABC transport system ATP-binding protein
MSGISGLRKRKAITQGRGPSSRSGSSSSAGNPNSHAGTDPGTLLSARGLTRSFGATPALRGADLEVATGEILAIMGPSGSGKSTLLHCLAGILTPDTGEVWFAGDRLDRLDDRTRTELRRRRFGFVFQFGQLVPELPSIENIALPLLLEGRPRAKALADAEPWFARLGLDGLERRRPGELSGGESQRVALARALVTRPDVIFADEPTGSLDSLAGEQVMDLLVDAARAQGTTVLVVTHEPRVAAYADREVVVRDGRVLGLERAGSGGGGAR